MDGIEYLLWRQTLADGHATTVYAVRHPRATTRVRVAHFPETERLDVWCAANDVDEAIIGEVLRAGPVPAARGALDRRPRGPGRAGRARLRGGAGLRGGLRGRGRPRAAGARAARAAGRPRPGRPLLVRDGTVVFDRERDEEGFSSGCGQFDSDITEGRHPRAALGISDEHYVAVACDGRRSRVDGGLDLAELATVMLELGAHTAINLDGGGSTTLVHRRHLLNRPYSTQDQPAPESRPIVSALLFEPRG